MPSFVEKGNLKFLSIQKIQLENILATGCDKQHIYASRRQHPLFSQCCQQFVFSATNNHHVFLTMYIRQHKHLQQKFTDITTKQQLSRSIPAQNHATRKIFIYSFFCCFFVAFALALLLPSFIANSLCFFFIFLFNGTARHVSFYLFLIFFFLKCFGNVPIFRFCRSLLQARHQQQQQKRWRQHHQQ